MNKTKGQKFVFALVVLAFCCLLLGGGSRLIASPQDEPALILPSVSWMNASLTCMPATQAQSLQQPQQEEENALGTALVCFAPTQRPMHALQTDANGNILGTVSYMRAVYQVFALGDGFV